MEKSGRSGEEDGKALLLGDCRWTRFKVFSQGAERGIPCCCSFVAMVTTFLHFFPSVVTVAIKHEFLGGRKMEFLPLGRRGGDLFGR